MVLGGFLVGKADGVGDDVGQAAVAFVGLPLQGGPCSVVEDPFQGFLDISLVPGLLQGVPHVVVECENDTPCGIWPVGY